MKKRRRIRLLVCIIAAAISFATLTFFVPQVSQEVQASGTEEFWRSLSTDYYYDQLTGSAKVLYERFDAACMNVLLSDNKTYSCIRVDIEDLDLTAEDEDLISDIYYMFRGSNPQYFFMDGYALMDSWQYENTYSRINLTMYNHEDHNFQNGAERDRVRDQIYDEILEYESVVPAGSRPETIERIVHDKMCNDLEYGYDASFAGTTYTMQSIVSAVEGTTVCNGYAMMFEALMNHLGVECIYVCSDPHAWNMINLHGYWYYVDVTNNDQDENGIFRIYYNCSSTALNGDPDLYMIEEPFSNYVPEVVYDDLDQVFGEPYYKYYSDRYVTVSGYTYFIVNDVNDDYGYLALPLYESSSLPSTVTYNGRTYNVIGGSSPVISTLQWYRSVNSGGTTTLQACQNSYNNTDNIMLRCTAGAGADTSNVHYEVSYNGSRVYTSGNNVLSGEYTVSYNGASVVSTASGTCLAPGSYTIAYYNGNNLIDSRTCTVTADVMTPADLCQEIAWANTTGGTNSYDNTTCIELDAYYDNGDDISDVYYQVRYNGNLIYTSERGQIEGVFDIRSTNAPTTQAGGNTYLSAGSYKVSFYYGNGILIDEDTATVTVSASSGGTTPSGGSSSGSTTPTGGTTPSSGTNPTGGTTPATGGPSVVNTPAPVTETGVAGFVERLYTIALGRASDPVGKQDWIDAITLRGNTGADAARGFLYSSEFLNKAVSNEEFTTILYRTFFNREPDEAGFNAWVAALNNGDSKQDVIEGFINSTEWANLCLTFGIASGGTGVPNIDVEPGEGTVDFCTRLYTTCLNRAADQGGLMAWARQLANQRDTGTGAARGFFFSSEFTNQNVNNGEYVTRLYRTFMGREPDEAGYNAWVGQLDSGVSREEVFDGFAGSQEFAAICASYGIVR